MSYQKFAKDIGIIGLTNLVVSVGPLVVLPIITKLLGPENYGIWAQILLALSLIPTIVTLGLFYSLVRFLAGEKDKEKIQEGFYSVLTIVFIIGLVLSLLIAVFSAPISIIFSDRKDLVLILAALTIVECLNLVFLNTFRAFQEMNKYSFFIIFLTLGELSLIITAILMGYGIFGAVLSLLIIRVIILFIMAVYFIRRIGIKIPNFSGIKEYLFFGLPTIPSNISYWVVQSIDMYLIGIFLGIIFVGYYAPAYTIASSINFFIVPFSFVLPAALSKFFDEKKIDEVKACLKYSLKYFLAISIPSLFGLSVLSRQLLTIFSTQEITEHSYFVVPIIALSMVVLGIYVIISQIISLEKKTKIIGIIWIIAAALSFGLNIILIPHLGIIGAALAVFISYFFVLTTTYYFSFRLIKFELDFGFILKSVFVSLLMAIIIHFFSPKTFLQTTLAIIFGVIFYFVSMFTLKGFEKKEVLFFLDLFQK